jgi:hypothetical protein
MGENAALTGYGVDAERGVPTPFTPQEREEFEMWERLSAEAFQMILDMEAEEGTNAAE